jgi:hypothetical protein
MSESSPQRRSSEAAATLAQASDYGSWYYENYLGPTYDPGEEHWLQFFGSIATQVVRLLGPRTACDAGCAMGILVGALREQGVDAEGIDVSEYAIEHADPRAAGHVRVGDLAAPLGRRFDVVTCIEVLEHIEAGQVEAVVANLCAATDAILLSSTPDEFNEGTHINVRPPSHWLSLFADHGFVRRFDVDASFVSPWAVLLERRSLDRRALVAAYETVLWDLRRENRGTRAAVIDRDRKLAQAGEQDRQLRARLAAASSPELDVHRLREAVLQERARAETAEREVATARADALAARHRLAAVEDSPRYRAFTAAIAPLRRARRVLLRARRRLRRSR